MLAGINNAAHDENIKTTNTGRHKLCISQPYQKRIQHKKRRNLKYQQKIKRKLNLDWKMMYVHMEYFILIFIT